MEKESYSKPERSGEGCRPRRGRGKSPRAGCAVTVGPGASCAASAGRPGAPPAPAASPGPVCGGGGRNGKCAEAAAAFPQRPKPGVVKICARASLFRLGSTSVSQSDRSQHRGHGTGTSGGYTSKDSLAGHRKAQ